MQMVSPKTFPLYAFPTKHAIAIGFRLVGFELFRCVVLNSASGPAEELHADSTWQQAFSELCKRLITAVNTSTPSGDDGAARSPTRTR
jgi:hypothetical protein